MKRAICIVLSALFCVILHASDNLGLKTVVIDPGHGGKDPGAQSADRRYSEKDFVLDISERLRDKINAECPDVKVLLTRTRDEYVELKDRAAAANDARADLFISIHINASPKTGPNGFSIHLLGKSSNRNRDLFAYNMDVYKRENSVIRLEDDYSTSYQDFDPDDTESMIFMLFMQSAYLEQGFKFAESVENSLKSGPIRADRGIWQDPFLVLWKTSMPAVLLELGFISNPEDLAVLKEESGRDKIAASICSAFKEYKISYDRSMSNEDFDAAE